MLHHNVLNRNVFGDEAALVYVADDLLLIRRHSRSGRHCYTPAKTTKRHNAKTTRADSTKRNVQQDATKKQNTGVSLNVVKDPWHMHWIHKSARAYAQHSTMRVCRRGMPEELFKTTTNPINPYSYLLILMQKPESFHESSLLCWFKCKDIFFIF